jgi:hypothetical protein
MPGIKASARRSGVVVRRGAWAVQGVAVVLISHENMVAVFATFSTNFYICIFGC